MLKQAKRQTEHPQTLRSKKISNNDAQRKRGNPSNFRVLRTNLVYAIGLWPEICSQSILSSDDYFGKYGKVLKIAINKKPNIDKKNSRLPTYSAVVTYDNEVSASLAVISLFQFKSPHGMIRGCYGCTKYCDIFFNGKICNKPHCLYMHQYDEERQINLTNGERYQDYDFERHLNMAIDISSAAICCIVDMFGNKKTEKGIFPDPYHSLRILIDNQLLTQQQYEKHWQQKQLESQVVKQMVDPIVRKKETSYSTLQSISGQSAQNQQQISDLDFQQNICNKIIKKIQKKNKTKSNLDFVENKPSSPRFIQQFRSFFGKNRIQYI